MSLQSGREHESLESILSKIESAKALKKRDIIQYGRLMGVEENRLSSTELQLKSSLTFRELDLRRALLGKSSFGLPTLATESKARIISPGRTMAGRNAVIYFDNPEFAEKFNLPANEGLVLAEVLPEMVERSKQLEMPEEERVLQQAVLGQLQQLEEARANCPKKIKLVQSGQEWRLNPGNQKVEVIVNSDFGIPIVNGDTAARWFPVNTVSAWLLQED